MGGCCYLDTRNEGHWDSLAEHLGADVKPEQPKPSKSVESPLRANTPVSREKPPAKSRPEPRSTDWSQLASSLGLIPAEPQQPVSSKSTTPRSGQRGDESSVDISHGEAFVEEIEIIDLFADDGPLGDETISSSTETRESETSEDNEDRPGNRRRRRRRGRRGRSGRRPELPETSLDHREQITDDEPAELVDEKISTSGESTIKNEERKGRRRRRRRDGRESALSNRMLSTIRLMILLTPVKHRSKLTRKPSIMKAILKVSEVIREEFPRGSMPLVISLLSIWNSVPSLPKQMATRGQHSRRGPRRGSRRRGKPNDRPSD